MTAEYVQIPPFYDLGTVVYAYSPRTWIADARILEVLGYSWVHSKFKTGLRYLSPCHKTKQPD